MREPFIASSKEKRKANNGTDFSNEQGKHGSIYMKTAVAVVCWRGISPYFKPVKK